EHPRARGGDGAPAGGPRRRDREPRVRPGARRDRRGLRPRLRARRARSGLAHARAPRRRTARRDPAAELTRRAAYVPLMRRLLAILLAIGLSRAAAAQWDEPPVAEPESTLTSLARPVWMVTQLHMGVPLLLDVDREVIRPGANLGLRLSVASRFFGGGVHASYQWIP